VVVHHISYVQAYAVQTQYWTSPCVYVVYLLVFVVSLRAYSKGPFGTNDISVHITAFTLSLAGSSRVGYHSLSSLWLVYIR
jgi:hypothetical protein